MHQSFCSGLKARLSERGQTGSGTDEEREKNRSGLDLMVGDLFLKMVRFPSSSGLAYFSTSQASRSSTLFCEFVTRNCRFKGS